MTTLQPPYTDRFRQAPMNTPLEEQRCENCRYRVGCECRRHAPQPSNKEDRLASWPVVANDGWCGEWVQR